MRKILALLLAFVMAAGLVGCTQTESVPETTVPATMAPPEPVKYTIHVLLPEGQEGWQGMAKQLALEEISALEAEGAFTVVQSVYGSAEQQNQILADIAAQSSGDGSVGVVLMPMSQETAPALEQLLEANVAYALADLVPEGAGAASVANVTCDQRQIGAAAAAYLVANGLTQDQKVVVIQGISEEEALRTEGFQLYLQGKLAYDGVMIETPWDSLDTIVYSDMQGTTQESAATYFETYMSESDHLSTKYFAAWEDTYVLGVLDALEGETLSDSAKAKFLEGAPFLTGCGGSQQLADVLAGTSAYTNAASFGGIQTVIYDAAMLRNALATLADHFSGQIVEQDQTQSIVWLTADNAAQHKGY